MSVNEDSSIEPTLAEVLASIRRIAAFEPDTPSMGTMHEHSLEDDPDFVVPAFLRPHAHRAPAERPKRSISYSPPSAEDRHSPVLPMPPVPPRQFLPHSSASAPPSAANWNVLPPALETPRRTLDSAAALFSHMPAAGPPAQTSASPWSDTAAVRPASHPLHDELDAAADLSADLLRPLLRQWLDENMSCMVAKALLSESVSFAADGKKTN